ncbi:MAG: hypothetical protein PUH08_02115, partial [Treponema sp.]|nr:hypothetical protein [Treponema sp.]
VVLSYSMITNFSIVVFRKRYLTHITTALRVFWAPSRLARLSLGQPCNNGIFDAFVRICGQLSEMSATWR